MLSNMAKGRTIAKFIIPYLLITTFRQRLEQCVEETRDDISSLRNIRLSKRENYRSDSAQRVQQ